MIQLVGVCVNLVYYPLTISRKCVYLIILQILYWVNYLKISRFKKAYVKVCSLRFCLPEKKIEGNPYVLSEREWLMEKTLLRYLLASNEKLRLGSLYRMVNMDLHFSMKIRIHSKRVYVDTGGSWPAPCASP